MEVSSTAVTTPSLKGASRMEKEGAAGDLRGLGSSVLTKLLAMLTLSISSSVAGGPGTVMAMLDRDL